MNEMVSDAVDLPTAAPPPADTQHDVADDTPEAGSVEQLKAAVERSLKELYPVDLDSPGGPKAAVPPDAARAPGSVPADRAEQREEQPPPITRPDDMPRAWGNDRIQLWQSLREDVRAQARELAASQEAYFHKQRDEFAKERDAWAKGNQDASAAAAQIREEHNKRVIEQGALDLARRMNEKYLENFPDVTTAEDATRLAKEDPARYASWRDWMVISKP
jgi:hypothetical protein